MESKELIIQKTEPFFKEILEEERLFNIAIFQGKIQSEHCVFKIWLQKNTSHADEVINLMNDLFQKESVRELILQYKAFQLKQEIKKFESSESPVDVLRANQCRKSFQELGWDWYVENCIKSCSDFLRLDWRLLIFSSLYEWYKKTVIPKFLPYYRDCPLEVYYRTKGVEIFPKKSYGLVPLRDDWSLKTNNSPKIYDSINNTHILIKYVPGEFCEFLAKLYNEYSFNLSLRPDYGICGDGIKDIQALCEELSFGRYFKSTLNEIAPLSNLYESKKFGNKLIVCHHGDDITFEEILEDFDVDGNSIVTQVIHLQYKVDIGVEYITHIDHEYVFYTVEQYEQKDGKNDLKGSAKSRYKTFKIDCASIPFITSVENNILIQALYAYFRNIDLIEEYFASIIERRVELGTDV